MQFFDSILLDSVSRRKTSDGYLVTTGLAARSGIQLYTGMDVGRPDMKTVRVYRPAEEVFAKDSLSTYARRPITDNHPSVLVNSRNHKELSVGIVDAEVARDGEHVRVGLMFTDQETINKLEGGKVELSAGYTCELDWSSGVTPAGEAYDAIQRSIKVNHVALVDAGRAGTARVSDGEQASKQPMEPSMTDVKTSLVVDGLTVSLDTRDAEIVRRTIDGLTTKLADAEKKAKDKEEELEKEKADKEKEMAKKDAAIDDLKKKVVEGAALDALVTKRADLITKARHIAGDGLKTEGLSDADIRKAVVSAKLGDEAIKDKSEAYIDARFDILAEDVKTADPIRSNAAGISSPVVADAESAYSKMIADMKSGTAN